MLSTAQALQEWDNVLKLLNEARSHAAAHPDQQTLPEGLVARMTSSTTVLNERSRGLASPVATWKQMLKLKISTGAVVLPETSGTSGSSNRILARSAWPPKVLLASSFDSLHMAIQIIVPYRHHS
jgi:hypothetical protein